jgi:transposase
MVRMIEDLTGDWRRLDERIEGLSNEIVAIARQDDGCERLMSVPGIGPIISSAMVAAIGAGDVFSKGRDFAAWLGLVPKQISTGDRWENSDNTECTDETSSAAMTYNKFRIWENSHDCF